MRKASKGKRKRSKCVLCYFFLSSCVEGGGVLDGGGYRAQGMTTTRSYPRDMGRLRRRGRFQRWLCECFRYKISSGETVALG